MLSVDSNRRDVLNGTSIVATSSRSPALLVRWPSRPSRAGLARWITADSCSALNQIAAMYQVERPLSRLRRDVLPGRQDLQNSTYKSNRRDVSSGAPFVATSSRCPARQAGPTNRTYWTYSVSWTPAVIAATIWSISSSVIVRGGIMTRIPPSGRTQTPCCLATSQTAAPRRCSQGKGVRVDLS